VSAMTVKTLGVSPKEQAASVSFTATISLYWLARVMFSAALSCNGADVARPAGTSIVVIEASVPGAARALDNDGQDTRRQERPRMSFRYNRLLHAF
jgi:hypothetical protein